MSNEYIPTEDEIASAKAKLIEYKIERSYILKFCRKNNLPIPKYDPPIDGFYAPYIGTPYTRTKNGIVYLPYPMKRAAKARYLNPLLHNYKSLITEDEWSLALANGFDDNVVAELIYSKYQDFHSLIRYLLNGNYDPAFRHFILKAGYVTDSKSYDRLASDWPMLLPFVVVKFINQFKISYRKTIGSYTTFFQNAFARILILSYIDYCRSVHKEDFRYKYDPFKHLNIDDTINIEDLPTEGDQFLFCNELYYYVVSKLVSTSSILNV